MNGFFTAVLCFLTALSLPAQSGKSLKKVVPAPLDFSGDTTLKKLDYSRLTFHKKVLFYHSGMKNELVFSDCELKGPINLSNTNFQGPVLFEYISFDSTLDLTFNHFARPLVISNIRSEQGIDFSSNNLSDTALFERTFFVGKASFINNGFYDHANYKASEFLNLAYFKENKFYSTSSFNGSKFKSLADFSMSQFSKNACFFNVNFDSLTVFESVKFDSAVFFSGSLFGSQSQVIFSSAEFQDQARFRDTKFQGTSNFVESVFAQKADFDSAHFSGKVDFSKAGFRKASFKKAVFESEVSFKDARFRDTLNFNHASFKGNVFFNSETRLPDYIDFSYVEWIEKTIDFTGCKSNTKGVVKINLTGTDISKIKIDYLHFRLCFDPKWSVVNDDDFEKMAAVYKDLLSNFDKNNLVSSYEILDKEFTDLKYRNRMGDKWVKIFSPYYWLKSIDLMWWDYGYKKGYIFTWTIILLMLFSVGSYFWYPWLKVVYPTRIMPYEEKGNPPYHQLPLRKRIYCAAIYTTIVFFSLNVQLDKIRWSPKRYLVFLIILYTAGLICEGYMINYVLAK